MIPEVKRAIRRRMPRAYQQIAAAKRWLLDPYERLLWRIGRRTNWHVASGPFAGMKYIPRNYGVRWAPQLIGCYEDELHPELERLLTHAYPYIVNIGAFEGYYAVGLARRLPHARVIAYEMSPLKRTYCQEMAAVNGVLDRFDIRGECTAAELAKNNLDDALVICDCEGFEEDILDPQIVGWLCKATMVVELHDCNRPGVTDKLQQRFAGAHDLKIFRSAPRDRAKYPVLAEETAEDAAMAMREDRVVNGQAVETPWGIWTPRES